MALRWTRRTTLAAAVAAGAARAQPPFPTRPLRVVVPFAPGGALDITARLLAREMEAELGQPIVAENRPGAGGNLGADAVAKAAPDGHTFLISSPGRWRSTRTCSGPCLTTRKRRWRRSRSSSSTRSSSWRRRGGRNGPSPTS